MNPHKRKWLIQAPLGLILVGFGACLIAEAAILKVNESISPDGATWHWVVAGTFALCVFNAGLCVFGNSILERIRYERGEL
jgi:hypothetical protein